MVLTYLLQDHNNNSNNNNNQINITSDSAFIFAKRGFFYNQAIKLGIRKKHLIFTENTIELVHTGFSRNRKRKLLTWNLSSLAKYQQVFLSKYLSKKIGQSNLRNNEIENEKLSILAKWNVISADFRFFWHL